MAITRQLANGQRLIDWTDDINNVAQQFGAIGAQNLFDMRPTSQSAIQFEISEDSITLLNETSKRERNVTKNKPASSKIIALPLPFFANSDYITFEDLDGYVQAGTEATPETAAHLRMLKIEKQRMRYDQTTEYMKLSAVKGVTVTPNGRVLADMFAETGITQTVINWNLSDPTLNVLQKIAELKSVLSKANKRGTAIQGFDVYVGTNFFFALINHPSVVAAYNNSNNMNNNRYYIDGTTSFAQFGVNNVFEFGGVRFLTYDATFNIEDANGVVTTVDAIDTNVGHTLLRSQGLLRGVYGTSNKLSAANVMGSPVYMYEWQGQRDESIELEMQFSHLYYNTQPETAIRLTKT